MNRLAAALVVLILAAAPVAAKPYFRLLRPLDEVKSGVFVKVGTPNENVLYGFQTTIVKHYAEDGALFIPGVSCSFVDLGFSKPEGSGNANVVIGPSIDLSEPIKAAILKGVSAAYPTSMNSVKALLQPTEPGRASVAVSIGPGLAVDPGDLKDAKTVKGAFVLHFGLSAKFGGAP